MFRSRQAVEIILMPEQGMPMQHCRATHHACLGTCTWAAWHRNTIMCNRLSLARLSSHLMGRPGAPPRPTAPSSSPGTPPAAPLHAGKPSISARCVPRRNAWAAPIYAKALLLVPCCHLHAQQRVVLRVIVIVTNTAQHLASEHRVRCLLCSSGCAPCNSSENQTFP